MSNLAKFCVLRDLAAKGIFFAPGLRDDVQV